MQLFGFSLLRVDLALHFHCISISDSYKLVRGASPSIRDSAGMSVLDRAMEMGAITDEELFVLLSEC